ncbi:MAG TPA: hypothetical protein VFE65_33860, partial [Pseudonocardia sp.]|nr:hypothetical protein [Pseudonocardia sp.]
MPVSGGGWPSSPWYPDGSFPDTGYDPHGWWYHQQYRFGAGSPEVHYEADPTHPIPVGQSGARSGFVVTGTAADLTEESIMRRRVDRPTSGWRGVVYA